MALHGEAEPGFCLDHRAMHSQYVSGITIRPLRTGETTLVQQVFDQLGARSRVLRFGGAKTALSATELAELALIDGRRHALVAFDGQVPIGIARLVCDAGDRTVAEVAFAVADSWQGRGVGKALFEQLTADARAAGITHLRSYIHAENRPSLALLKRFTTIIETHATGCELEVVSLSAA
jgi:GNAT superfamily N-acetyltransferase